MTTRRGDSAQVPHDFTLQARTRYARTSDGLNIAFQAFGQGESDVVLISDMSMTLETVWDEPVTAAALRRLASFARVILFDSRGKGGSDANPDGGVSTIEQMGEDIRAVMAAAHSARAAVIAPGETGAIGILHAASFPDQVSALVLINTHARLAEAADYPIGVSVQMQEVILAAVEHWGGAVGINVVAPNRATQSAFATWYARALRTSGGPSATLARIKRNLGTDVRALLPLVQAPTLVLHTSDNLYVNVAHGRYLAAAIPGAVLMELPGSDHIIPALDLDAVLGEITEFLTGARVTAPIDRVAATVLITDIVGSTEMLTRLGDSTWSTMLDRHDWIVRRNLDRYAGNLIKSTGDGVLSIFDGPARAVRCACTLRDDLRQLGLEVRTGLHTGEVQLRDRDVAGLAVHVAARVESLAEPGEVLVSQNVTDLIAGSGIDFADRGDHVLKGVPGSWRIFAVSEAGAA